MTSYHRHEMDFNKVVEWLRRRKKDWGLRKEKGSKEEQNVIAVIQSQPSESWVNAPQSPSLGKMGDGVMAGQVWRSVFLSKALRSLYVFTFGTREASRGCRGTLPTPGSPAGQEAALPELLCSSLFVKTSLHCLMCYIPVKSDLIIFLWFRSLHVLRYSVKVI